MLHALPVPAFFARLFAASPPPRVTRWFAAHVRQGATRHLAPPAGRVTVHCRSGEAWLTQDGDPKDVVLQAAESHRLARRDRLTVHALRGDCVLEIEVDEPAA